MTTYSNAAILCVATNGFDILWSFCIESQKRYAHRIGCEFYLERTNPWPDLTPHWSKFRRAVEILDSHKDLLILDADILVRNHTPSFEEILATKPDFDIFVAMGRSGRPNSGFIILRGGPESRGRQLIQTCLENRTIELPEQDFVTSYGENGHFIHFCRSEPFKSALFEIPKSWNRTEFPVNETDYNVHFTGPLASGRDILDECVPLSNIIPKSNKVLEIVRRAYFDNRIAIKKIFRKLPGGTKLARSVGGVSEMMADLRAPVRGQGLQNAFWRIEAPMRTLEYPTTMVVRQLLRPGDTVVDAGAHVGYFSRIFAEVVGPSGYVLAIEAHPENARLLRQNTAGLGVEIVEVALSEQPSEVAFFEGSGHSNHSLFEDASLASGKIVVKAERMDTVLRRHRMSEVSLMKMDIEGAEIAALHSVQSFLARGAFKAVLIEINPRVMKAAGKSVVDLSRLFVRHGYTLRQIRDDYHFGPSGFVSRRETANYIAARPEEWQRIAALLGIGIRCA